MRRLLLALFLVLATPLMAEVRHVTLPNGITYYIWPGGHEERARLQLVVPVGSVHEEEHERGLAHLMEHLMFRGTAAHSQASIMDYLRSIRAVMGPDINAFTAFDRTVYVLDVPADDLAAIAQGLSIMRGWLTDATLHHRDIEEERSIVLEEWRLCLGGSGKLEALVKLALPGSRFADRLPIGLPEVIRHATPNTIREFYRRWYLHAPAAVIVTGAVNPDAIEDLITSLFAPLSLRSWDYIPAFLTSHGAEVRIVVEQDPQEPFSTVEVIVGNSGFSSREQSFGELMTREYYHRLMRRRLSTLVASGLAESTTSYQLAMGTTGLCHCVEVTCREDQILTVVSNLASILNDIEQNGFSLEELTSMQNDFSLRRSMYQDDEQFSTHEKAEMCVEEFMDRVPLLWRTLEEATSAVSLEGLKTLSAHIGLAGGGLILVTSNALPTAPGVEVEQVQAAWDHPTVAEQLEPFLDSIPIPLPAADPSPLGDVTERQVLAGGLTTWHLQNGMRVHLLPRPGPRLSLWGVATGGLAHLPREQMVAGRLANGALALSGVGPFSKSLSLSRSITTLSRHLHGYCFDSSLEQLLTLIQLTFTSPEVTAAAVEQARLGWLRQNAALHLNSNLLFQARNREMTFQNHPLFVTPGVDELNAVTREAVSEVARQAFSEPADFDLFFVGEVDPTLFEERIRQYLATIPGTGPSPLAPVLPIEFPSGIRVDRLVMGSEPETKIILTFPVALQSTPVEFATARLMTKLIGNRTVDLIRHRLSATYHVTSDLEFIYPDLKSGRLSLAFSCLPEDAEVLSLMTLRELRRLKEQGPLEDELEFLRYQALRDLKLSQEFNEFWSLECGRYRELGWDLTGITRLEEPIYAITLEGAHGVLKQMLPLDRYTLMMSFPELTN